MSIWEKSQDDDEKRSAFDKLTNRPLSKVNVKPITKGSMMFKSRYNSTDAIGRIFLEFRPRVTYRIIRIKCIQFVSDGTPRNVQVSISDPDAAVGAFKAANFNDIPDGITYIDPGDGCIQGPDGEYTHIFLGGDNGLGSGITAATGSGVGTFDADYPENLYLKAGKVYDITAGSMMSAIVGAAIIETHLILDYEQIPT